MPLLGPGQELALESGEWPGVAGEWRRTKSYWWSGGFAAARQARPDAVKTINN
jgi:hypothetical protein